MITDDNTGNQVAPGADANDFQAPAQPTTSGTYIVPQDPSGFTTPKQSKLIDELEAMLRHPDHYAVALPLLNAIAGTTDPINGSPKWDWNRLVFDFQAEAKKNGYMLAAAATAADISPKLQFALSRVIPHEEDEPRFTLTRLREHGNQLRLEREKRAALEHQKAAE